tara:strand:+ start:5642 stop:6835 length:1194 start_codon:yes stop_codon:yes gene_type:complete
MWTDTNINFGKKSLRHCCKQIAAGMSIEDINELGANLFEQHPLNVSNRKEMVEEAKLPASCQWCIESEPNSIKDIWNTWSDEFITDNQSQLIENSYVEYIELDIGSSCDMACVYCGPWSSTTWSKELGQAASNTIDQAWRDAMLEQLVKYIATVPASRQLTFNILGGEPLLMVDTYHMIEYIGKHCGHFEKKPVIMLTTNLNCKEKLLEKLKTTIAATHDQFEWVISISIENVGKRAEMVRYHLDWERFNHNVHEIKDLVDRIYLTNTFSLLSFGNFDEFIVWAFDTFGHDGYTTTWDFSLNTVQEGFTDIAYVDPSLVDPDRIKTVYMSEVTKCSDPAQWRIDQLITHIDNLYTRLGTKKVDVRFYNFWNVMSKRRNVDYLSLHPIDKMINQELPQ